MSFVFDLVNDDHDIKLNSCFKFVDLLLFGKDSRINNSNSVFLTVLTSQKIYQERLHVTLGKVGCICEVVPLINKAMMNYSSQNFCLLEQPLCVISFRHFNTHCLVGKTLAVSMDVLYHKTE